MIKVGEWYFVDSKMLYLMLKPLRRKSPQKKLFVSDLRLTIDELLPVLWILVGWEGKAMYPIMYSGD
jgi:hypothetical protein